MYVCGKFILQLQFIRNAKNNAVAAFLNLISTEIYSNYVLDFDVVDSRKIVF